MAQTGVARLVVNDGESFSDRLFALGGQDRGARKRRPQVWGRRQRMIDWRRLGPYGVLENDNTLCSRLLRL